MATSEEDRIRELLLVTGECISLLHQQRIEEYLSLESERRHIFDSLPAKPDRQLKPLLEELKGLTDALSGEVARVMSELRSKMDPPSSKEGSYSSWA